MLFQNVKKATKNIHENFYFDLKKLKKQLIILAKTFNVISKC